jgi:hypothetical protein
MKLDSKIDQSTRMLIGLINSILLLKQKATPKVKGSTVAICLMVLATQSHAQENPWVKQDGSYNQGVGARNYYLRTCQIANQRANPSITGGFSCDYDNNLVEYMGQRKKGYSVNSPEVERVYEAKNLPGIQKPLLFVSRDTSGRDGIYTGVQVSMDEFERLIPIQRFLRAKCLFYGNADKTKIGSLSFAVGPSIKKPGTIELLGQQMNWAQTVTTGWISKKESLNKSTEKLECKVTSFLTAQSGQSAILSCQSRETNLRIDINLIPEIQEMNSSGTGGIIGALGCFAGGPCGSTKYEYKYVRAMLQRESELENITCSVY